MSNTPKRYPLQWPLGHPRAEERRKSLFKELGIETAYWLLNEELRIWGATGVVISTNLKLQRGQDVPNDVFPGPKDPGVAVYFHLNDEMKVIPCDAYLTVAENLRGLEQVINSLRAIERNGGTGVFSTAISGFQALPAKGETTGARWWDILELTPDATEQEINQAFVRLSKVYHPDIAGGSHELMATLSEARTQAQAAIKKP